MAIWKMRHGGLAVAHCSDLWGNFRVMLVYRDGDVDFPVCGLSVLLRFT